MLVQHINTGKYTAPPCSFSKTINEVNYFPIPGSDFVGAGFDTLTMQPKLPLLDMEHYFKNNMWTNPFYDNYSYIVSDRMTVFDNTESVEQNLTFISFKQIDFQNTYHDHVSSHYNYFISKGDKSADTIIFNQYFEEQSRFQATYKRRITWYDLELSPMVQAFYLDNLHDWAKPFFSALDRNLNEETKKAYWKILDAFGDSLVVRVSMGGGIAYKSFLSENIVNVVSVEQIQQSCSNSFLGIFGGHGNYDYLSNYTNKSFLKDAVAHIKFTGGHYPLPPMNFLENKNGFYSFKLQDVTTSLGDWDDFVRSIKDNLAPVHYELIPIYMMFDDLVIRNNMKIVTEEFMKKKN